MQCEMIGGNTIPVFAGLDCIARIRRYDGDATGQNGWAGVCMGFAEIVTYIRDQNSTTYPCKRIDCLCIRCGSESVEETGSEKLLVPTSG